MNAAELEEKLNGMGLIVAKLEQWAMERADKTFIYYGEEDRHYSYREFNELSNALAHNLRAMGVCKGDRVSLFVKNPMATVLVMFSLWKLGAVFCPINFGYRDKLLAYHLNDTAPVLFITESSCAPLFSEIADQISCRRVVMYDPEAGKLGGSPTAASGAAGLLDRAYEVSSFHQLLLGDTHNPEVEVHPWDTANIVYTSGTTGPPKGVVQSCRWLQNYCYYGVRMLHPDDVVYCDLPLYHIGGAFSLVGRAAWAGCSVSLWDRFSTSRFWDRIKASGATYTLLLDVVLPRLLGRPPRPDDRDNTLRRVHMQPLPEYHQEFCRRFGIDFVNVGYGSTEIGYACAGLIDETVSGGGTPEAFRKGYSREQMLAIAEELDVPVVPADTAISKGYMGKPCIFHELKIVGEHDEELPVGEHGQIALRSRLPYVLLNGYFNKPAATAEAFRNLWFHTGDGSYRTDAGCCHFVDRLGGFMRVKGENVSSSQVEEMLTGHPQVSMAAVFPVPAAEGLEDDIVAFIIPAEGMQLASDGLREWVVEKLPKYMWPKHLRIVDSLPKTPTHKVEKYKLKQIFREQVDNTPSL